MNEFWEENKNKIIVIGVIVALVIVFTVINSLNGKTVKKDSPEKGAKDLAKVYYEELFYPYIKENYTRNYNDIIMSYEESGIKVTLLKMITSIKNANVSVFSDEKNNTSCDLTLSYVIIRPMSPYEFDDYSIETNLKCDIGVANETDDDDEDGE